MKQLLAKLGELSNRLNDGTKGTRGSNRWTTIGGAAPPTDDVPGGLPRHSRAGLH